MFGELLAPIYLGWLLQGFAVTVALSFATTVAAALLALPICAARLAGNALIRAPAQAYLALFRSTPLLAQLFFWYFGASSLLPAGTLAWLNTPRSIDLGVSTLPWPPFEILAGFFALTLYTAAFVAEEYRAGVQTVAPGQRDAALALGLSPRSAFLLVIAPQAARNALPPLLGQGMNAIKNSSMTMAIGLAELSYAARQVETETFKTFQAFGIATLLYMLAIVFVEFAGVLLLKRPVPLPR